MNKQTLNDQDRAQWIDNDQGLYSWWKSSQQGKSKFINENRAELTRLIRAQLDKKPLR